MPWWKKSRQKLLRRMNLNVGFIIFFGISRVRGFQHQDQYSSSFFEPILLSNRNVAWDLDGRIQLVVVENFEFGNLDIKTNNFLGFAKKHGLKAQSAKLLVKTSQKSKRTSR